jgi:hypothetical protein
VDHVDPNVINYLVGHFADAVNPQGEKRVVTLTAPHELTVPCGLYGPAVGDPPIPESDVVYGPRENRLWASRLVRRPFRATSMLTVVMGPWRGRELVLFSCYGGPAAPREPAEMTLAGDAVTEESERFWAEHALAVPGVVNFPPPTKGRTPR